jgi:hypothetical protein
MGAADVARSAAKQLGALTGRPVEGVLGLESNGNGGWKVMLEVLELRRIPDSTDVLGSYEVAVDEQGELIAYHRVRRYPRNQVEEA